ncbi:MAG: hypothetical protein HKN72_04410 [Gemmatimonadetes bacterium]|nr:hypothetical protein [Gemmatimonadota bacterium]NNF12437.1 hypothetical protein [Gemmatimonadota bacterium]
MTMASSTLHSSPGNDPADYRRLRVGSARVLTLPVAEPWTREAIRTSGTLHEWAAAHPNGASFPGRGQVHAIDAPVEGPDGRSRWAVRHYNRGGAVAARLGDRYLRGGRSRPQREIRAAAAARDRGVRTPAVVAGAVYPAGIYYRCDLVTEVVPGAKTLAHTAHATDGTRAWLEAMAAAGRLASDLAEAGILHVDLNAHNILFEEGDATRAWVIDLDRARIRARSDSDTAERMLARLTRSVVKVGTPTGESLGDREVLAALRGKA